MFKYEGYTEYMFGGIILTFSKDGNKYTMLNQQWDDDLDIDVAGNEIAYYLSDGEWNTDDLILES